MIHSAYLIIVLLFILDRKILTVATSVKATASNVAYVQASNLRDQLGTATGKVVTYSGVDGLEGYTVFKNGTIAPEDAGVSLRIFAAQTGSPRGNGAGEIHLWSQKNGQSWS